MNDFSLPCWYTYGRVRSLVGIRIKEFSLYVGIRMNGFALLSVNLYIRKFRSFVYVSNTVVHVKVSYMNFKIMSMPTKSYIYIIKTKTYSD